MKLSATLVAIALATAVPAAACSCIPVPAPDVAFDEAAAVFEAVIAEQRVDGIDVEVDFVVERSWKGVTTTTATAHTWSTEATCGYVFEKGKSYLVYAYDLSADGHAPKYGVSLCSRTRRIEEAAEDLAYLSGHPIVDADAQSWTTAKARFQP